MLKLTETRLDWTGRAVETVKPAPSFPKQARSSLAYHVNEAADVLPAAFWAIDGGRVWESPASASKPASKPAKQAHPYTEMSAEQLMNLGRLHNTVGRDEVLDSFGSVETYHKHVKVWRLARLAVHLAAHNTGEDLMACCCDLSDDACDKAEQGDLSALASEHAACEAPGCDCSLHAVDCFNDLLDTFIDSKYPKKRVTGLDKAIRDAIDADEAWQALTTEEQAAHRERVRKTRAACRMHYAGSVTGGSALARLLARLTEAKAEAEAEAKAEAKAAETALDVSALDVDSEPAPDGLDEDIDASIAGHTCQSKRRGESWADYFGRRDNCEACKAGSLVYGDPTESIPVWDGLQGDRLASFGRSPEAGRLGNRRMSEAS